MQRILQVDMIRMPLQLRYFEQYQQRVSGMIGEEQAKRLVRESLVLITLGGNDFVNNYFLVPLSARSRQYNLPNYVTFIISEYRKILQVTNNVKFHLFRITSFLLFQNLRKHKFLLCSCCFLKASTYPSLVPRTKYYCA